MNLKELLPPGSAAKILAHLMQWFQVGNAHSLNTGVTYNSSDPLVIAHQVKKAQACGIDGFLVDWYGPASVNAFGDLAFKNLLMVSAILGFQAGICIDKGAIKNLMATGLTAQNAFQVAYNYVTSIYGTQPAFFNDYILEFGCSALGVNFSGFPAKLIHDNPTFGSYFTWVGLPNGASSVATHYSDPNCKIGSVCWGFNDGAPSNLNTSVWGGSVRLLDRCHLGSNWKECWENIPPSLSYVQIVTWNDYEEGTAIEGVMEML